MYNYENTDYVSSMCIFYPQQPSVQCSTDYGRPFPPFPINTNTLYSVFFSMRFYHLNLVSMEVRVGA